MLKILVKQWQEIVCYIIIIFCQGKRNIVANIQIFPMQSKFLANIGIFKSISDWWNIDTIFLRNIINISFILGKVQENILINLNRKQTLRNLLTMIICKRTLYIFFFIRNMANIIFMKAYIACIIFITSITFMK